MLCADIEVKIQPPLSSRWAFCPKITCLYFLVPDNNIAVIFSFKILYSFIEYWRVFLYKKCLLTRRSYEYFKKIKNNHSYLKLTKVFGTCIHIPTQSHHLTILLSALCFSVLSCFPSFCSFPPAWFQPIGNWGEKSTVYFFDPCHIPLPIIKSLISLHFPTLIYLKPAAPPPLPSNLQRNHYHCH